MRQVALGFLLTALSVTAQVSAPQLGWIPDGTSIRPVSGIPAAAAVGAAVLPDQDFSQIAPSPERNYVLVSAAGSGVVSVYTPENGLVALSGAGTAPDLVVVSPRGSAAVLYFSVNNQAQIVTGLPDAPAIRRIDLAVQGTAPNALAISDDGAWLSVASIAGVYAFGPKGEAGRLPVDDRAAAIAFLESSHDLAVAGAAGLQLVKDIGSAASVADVLTSPDASWQPVAIAAVSSNQALVLADRNGSIVTVNLASKAAATVSCACVPEGLFGLGPSAFRLTSLQNGAFELFDAARGEILFAPVALTQSDDRARRGLGDRR